VRRISEVLSSRSSDATWRETLGWVRKSVLAAFEKEPCRATSRNVLSRWTLSISQPSASSEAGVRSAVIE
jgi:hypothetical protein